MMEKLWNWIATRAANKLVGQLAVALVTYGLLKQDKASDWISSNTEIVAAGITLLGSWLWSWWKHRKDQKQQTSTVEAALFTAPPGYVLLPVEQAPQQNFSGGGIRAGEESIAPDKFRPEEHL